MNKLRKIIQKTGFDLHRHRPKADYWQFLRDQNIKTVLDIGANIGQFAKEAREALPEAQIYSFEPVKSCFETLEASFKEDREFKAFNYALGDQYEKTEINKSAYAPSSSLLKMSDTHKNLFPHTKDHSGEIIEVRRLDEIVKELNLPDGKAGLNKNIFIKVDVQGFEDKVINGGIETFKKAKVILLETSFTELYTGQPNFDDIYEKMKLLGFTYKGSLQQKLNKHTGEVISEDSIFILN